MRPDDSLTRWSWVQQCRVGRVVQGAEEEEEAEQQEEMAEAGKRCELPSRL